MGINLLAHLEEGSLDITLLYGSNLKVTQASFPLVLQKALTQNHGTARLHAHHTQRPKSSQADTPITWNITGSNMQTAPSTTHKPNSSRPPNVAHTSQSAPVGPAFALCPQILTTVKALSRQSSFEPFEVGKTVVLFCT